MDIECPLCNCCQIRADWDFIGDQRKWNLRMQNRSDRPDQGKGRSGWTNCCEHALRLSDEYETYLLINITHMLSP